MRDAQIVVGGHTECATGQSRSRWPLTRQPRRAPGPGEWGSGLPCVRARSACRLANGLLIRRRGLRRRTGSWSGTRCHEARAQRLCRPFDAAGRHGWRDRSSPPSDTRIGCAVGALATRRRTSASSDQDQPSSTRAVGAAGGSLRVTVEFDRSRRSMCTHLGHHLVLGLSPRLRQGNVVEGE
jgi:hypothetical protein